MYKDEEKHVHYIKGKNNTRISLSHEGQTQRDTVWGYKTVCDYWVYNTPINHLTSSSLCYWLQISEASKRINFSLSTSEASKLSKFCLLNFVLVPVSRQTKASYQTLRLQGSRHVTLLRQSTSFTQVLGQIERNQAVEAPSTLRKTLSNSICNSSWELVI